MEGLEGSGFRVEGFFFSGPTEVLQNQLCSKVGDLNSKFLGILDPEPKQLPRPPEYP